MHTWMSSGNQFHCSLGTYEGVEDVVRAAILASGFALSPHKPLNGHLTRGQATTQVNAGETSKRQGFFESFKFPKFYLIKFHPATQAGRYPQILVLVLAWQLWLQASVIGVV
jgi:hypothetical protein